MLSSLVFLRLLGLAIFHGYNGYPDDHHDQLHRSAGPDAFLSAALRNRGALSGILRVDPTVLNAPAGLFNGSFTITGATITANRVAPCYGQTVRIVTPSCDTTRGYGFFLLPTFPVSPQNVSTSPKLSGKVTFTAPRPASAGLIIG